MGTCVIKATEKGSHFVLKADNGEVIATSQIYKSKESCKKGIESVKRNAPDAAVVEEVVEQPRERRPAAHHVTGAT